MSRAEDQQQVRDLLVNYRYSYGKEDFKEFLVAISKYVIFAPTKTESEVMDTENEAAKASATALAEKFTVPKKSNKRPRAEAAEAVSVSNKFETLSQMEETQQDKEHVRCEPFLIRKPKQQPKANDISKEGRIAPLVIRERLQWTKISKLMNDKKINYVKAKVVKLGILVEPATEDDYRQLYKLLDKEKAQFHAYELKSEKKLKIVLRGVLTEVTEEEVKEDLELQGYPATKIVRMKGRDSRPAPLVLVEIDKEYKSIFTNLSQCLGLEIQVESLKVKSEVAQCHKCQEFGHVQKHCHAEFKCMKCGQSHMTSECTKPVTTLPGCANCQGTHLSTFVKCPKNPNNPELRPPPANKFKFAPQPTNVWQQRAAQRNDQKPQENGEEELALILGRMAIQFYATNATIESKIKFVEEQQKIVQLFQKKKR